MMGKEKTRLKCYNYFDNRRKGRDFLNKKIIPCLFLIGMTTFLPSALANDNGENNIGELKIKSKIEKKDNGRYIENNDNTSIGQIKISQKNIYKVLKENNRKNPSEEATKILSELNKIVSFQNERDFKSALKNIEELSKNYQEFPEFRKWAGIYQNELHEYSDSLESFETVRNLFPFNESIYDMDIRYYEINNLIHLKKYEEAKEKIKAYQEKINNENEKFLCDYLKFLLATKETGNIEKHDLDKLWEKIPENDERFLNVEKGVNLDELGYIYGKFYNRKDVLKKYVERNEKFRDTETIQNIISAKEIIFSKY